VPPLSFLFKSIYRVTILIPKWFFAYAIGLISGAFIVELYYYVLRRVEARRYEKQLKLQERLDELSEIERRNEELHDYNYRVREIMWKQMAQKQDWDTVTPTSPNQAPTKNLKHNTPVDPVDYLE